jgi:hypothetical protein
MRMLAIAKGLIDRFGPNKFVIVQDRSGWFYVGIAGGNIKRISPRFESQKDVHDFHSVLMKDRIDAAESE